MYKISQAAIFIASTSLLICSTLTAGQRWDYLDLSYTFDGELATNSTDPEYKGPTLDASTSLNSNLFFLRGQSTSYASDDEFGIIPNSDSTFVDWTSIGPGMHHSNRIGQMNLDLWGQVTMNRAVFASTATKGMGAALGARFHIAPNFETSLSYRQAKADRNYNGGKIIFNPSLWTLETLYFLTPSSAVRFAYSNGRADIEGGTLELKPESIDINEMQIGYRHIFGMHEKPDHETPKHLTFNFIQMDYIFNGGISIQTRTITRKLDVSRGLAIKGAFEISRTFFFGGEILTFDYDGALIPNQNNVFSINDMSFFGPGAYFRLTDSAQIYAQIGLQKVHYIYVPLEGYGVKAGAKAKIGSAELHAWYQYGKTDGKIDGLTMTLKPNLYGAEIAIEFAPKMPELVIGYTDGKFEGDIGTPLQPLTMSQRTTSLGVRFRY